MGAPFVRTAAMHRSLRSGICLARRLPCRSRATERGVQSPNGSTRGFALGQRAAELLQKQVKKAALSRIDDHLNGHWGRYDNRNESVDTPTIFVADPALNYSPRSGLDALNDLFGDIDRPAVGEFPIDISGAADPFSLVAGDIVCLSEGIKQLLGSDHPVLSAAAKYFFELDGGKKIRPTMVLLISRAANRHKIAQGSHSMEEICEHVLASQRRLAEITEMIHTASLLHDDVIDVADTRRGVSSVNSLFGNKLAILAGDFLLARASVSLARLRNVEVIEILSTVIEHLVKGEVMQMRAANGDLQVGGVNGHDADSDAPNGVNGSRTFNGSNKSSSTMSTFEHYLRKNYYKTGSLMANSCRAAAVLGDHSKELEDIAFAYGKHLGLAFQLIDDVLDFEGSTLSLGKPALNDLKQGLVTAPVLFAQEESPELVTLIRRKFQDPGDVEYAANLVQESQGLRRAKDLALSQAELACEAVMQLTPSPERDALVKLAHKVVTRSK